MDTSTIYQQTEQHVRELFRLHQSPKLLFHNLHHTEYVVQRAREIADNYDLNDQDKLILHLATWFHDTGYLFSSAQEHEAKSVEIMKQFAREQQVPFDIVSEVQGCIMATKMPRDPHGLLQEIISDADTYNFGTKEFKFTNELVYREIQGFTDTALSKRKFDESALEMLRDHQFYTGYCRDHLKEGKKANIKKLKSKLDKKYVTEYESAEPDSVITEKDGTGKGIQTLLRLTSSNHIKLSDMADSKANILISVNSIIISVILSVLLRKLQTDSYLIIPTVLFLVFSVVTIVIAILSTRPSVNAGRFSKEDIMAKKTNLLFFGNFHRMQLNEYDQAMRILMKDSDYLYTAIIQDIYYLGVVLGRKYKLIRLAYNIFMIGIIVSVAAFALATWLHTPPVPGVTGTNTSGSPF